MNCVKCGKWMFFGDVDTCRACQQDAQKMAEWSAHYTEQKKQGDFSASWAVIDCYFRAKFDVRDTARILGLSVRDVELEIDIARQNAR